MRYFCFLLLLLAGCGTAQSAAPPVLDYPAEIRAQYPLMKWPADVTPDLDALIKLTGPPAGEQAPPGQSRQTLAVVNTCAWYRSWDLAVQRGDAAAVAASLAAMTDVVTRYPPEADAAGREYVRDAARQAAAGNGDLARDYVSANCFDTKWTP